MLRSTRTAFKFFVYGLLIGLFFAPRPGEETRQQVLDWFGNMMTDLLGGEAGTPTA